jgi:hypothetical protein
METVSCSQGLSSTTDWETTEVSTVDHQIDPAKSDYGQPTTLKGTIPSLLSGSGASTQSSASQRLQEAYRSNLDTSFTGPPSDKWTTVESSRSFMTASTTIVTTASPKADDG